MKLELKLEQNKTIVPAEAIPSAGWVTQSHYRYIHYVQAQQYSPISTVPFFPQGRGGGNNVQLSGERGSQPCVLSLAAAIVVVEPAPPKRALAFPFIPGMAEWCTS